MTRDRLDSLRAACARQQDGSSDSDGHSEEEGDAGARDSTMKSFFEEVEGVRADMESIRRVMAEVGVKQSALLSEPRCEERLKVQFRSSSRCHMGNAEIYFWDALGNVSISVNIQFKYKSLH